MGGEETFQKETWDTQEAQGQKLVTNLYGTVSVYEHQVWACGCLLAEEQAHLYFQQVTPFMTLVFYISNAFKLSGETNYIVLNEYPIIFIGHFSGDGSDVYLACKL